MTRTSRTLAEGLMLGGLAYAAVAFFYAAFDVLAARGSLYSVDLLGKALFRGLRDPSVLQLPIALDPTAIFLYNGLHFVTLARHRGVHRVAGPTCGARHPRRLRVPRGHRGGVLRDRGRASERDRLYSLAAPHMVHRRGERRRRLGGRCRAGLEASGGGRHLTAIPRPSHDPPVLRPAHRGRASDSVTYASVRAVSLAPAGHASFMAVDLCLRTRCIIDLTEEG